MYRIISFSGRGTNKKAVKSLYGLTQNEQLHSYKDNDQSEMLCMNDIYLII